MLSPRPVPLAASPLPVDAPALARAAVAALHDELALYPKPGLVSFIDSGSHEDMDGATFLRSLFSLRRYFQQIAAAGAGGAAFEALEALGIAAEARMLAATGGINTHRGAIFVLGLLCAAGGALQARGAVWAAPALRATLGQHWGAALQARAQRHADSKGGRVARQLGLRGAGAEAALGFPVLFEHTLPALQAALARGLDARRARLHALFAAMAVLDDTTLAHRGGLQGLRFAQAAAREFLQAGGGAQPRAIEHAQDIHHRFVQQRLSAGGAADMLAAACWLQRLTARGRAAP